MIKNDFQASSELRILSKREIDNLFDIRNAAKGHKIGAVIGTLVNAGLTTKFGYNVVNDISEDPVGWTIFWGILSFYAAKHTYKSAVSIFKEPLSLEYLDQKIRDEDIEDYAFISIPHVELS